MSCRENWQRELVIKYRFYFPEKYANFFTKTFKQDVIYLIFPKDLTHLTFLSEN